MLQISLHGNEVGAAPLISLLKALFLPQTAAMQRSSWPGAQRPSTKSILQRPGSLTNS